MSYASLTIATVAALTLSQTAYAESFEFEVQNGTDQGNALTSQTSAQGNGQGGTINLFPGSERVTTSTRQGAGARTLALGGGAGVSDVLSGAEGSLTFGRIIGDDNTLSTAVVASAGAMAAGVQVGQDNRGQVVIVDSPGSTGAFFQGGNNLSTNILIVRGQNNAVGTTQFGNSSSLSVGLYDSQSTTLVYGQVGSNVGGSYSFRNAPPGTVITVGQVGN